MLAKQLSILTLCEMYFAEVGMIFHDKKAKKLEAQPMLVNYNSFTRSAHQTMRALGLGPHARVKIDMDKASVGKTLKQKGAKDFFGEYCKRPISFNNYRQPLPEEMKE
jgi:phage terminase small subunit